MVYRAKPSPLSSNLTDWFATSGMKIHKIDKYIFSGKRDQIFTILIKIEIYSVTYNTSDNRYSSCFGLPFWLHFLPLRSFSFSNIRIKILVNHLRNPHKLLTQPKLKTICHNITLLYSHYGTLIQVSRTILGLTSGREKKVTLSWS